MSNITNPNPLSTDSQNTNNVKLQELNIKMSQLKESMPQMQAKGISPLNPKVQNIAPPSANSPLLQTNHPEISIASNQPVARQPGPPIIDMNTGNESSDKLMGQTKEHNGPEVTEHQMLDDLKKASEENPQAKTIVEAGNTSEVRFFQGGKQVSAESFAKLYPNQSKVVVQDNPGKVQKQMNEASQPFIPAENRTVPAPEEKKVMKSHSFAKILLFVGIILVAIAGGILLNDKITELINNLK